MAQSRKRLRPLDPGEERALHSSNALPISLLDDVRSYCFSWPGAPLTAWITSCPTYAGAHVYKSTAAAAAAAVAASATAVSAVTNTVPTAPALVVAPPTFSVADLLRDDGCGGRYESMDGTETVRARGRGRGAALATAYDDVACLLAPFVGSLTVGIRDYSSNVAVASTTLVRSPSLKATASPSPPSAGLDCHVSRDSPCGPSTIIMDRAVLRVSAHPRSPPRPLCVGEDSIFSLSAEQLADAVAAGLLSSTAGDNNSYDGRTDGGSEGPAAALARRRRIEWEVAGLEWRAFAESRRTASALQRLLSLQAAVPFEPLSFSSAGTNVAEHKHALSSAKAAADAVRVTAGIGQDGRTVTFEPTDAWRCAVYTLWLRWRVGVFAVATAADDGRGGATTSTTATIAAATVSAGLPARHLHPWGTPLMPGAYLYDTQSDYFLNPARTSAVAVGSAAATSSCGSAAACAEGGMRKPSSPTAGMEGGGRRRRGPYSFLGWRIEHYTPQLQRLVDAGAMDMVTSSDGMVSYVSHSGGGRRCSGRGTLEHTAYHPVLTRRQQRQLDAAAAEGGGGGGGGNALLSGSCIEALVRNVVLSRPLLDVELDAMGTVGRVDALEWGDLRRDTEMWRTWLSKM